MKIFLQMNLDKGYALKDVVENWDLLYQPSVSAENEKVGLKIPPMNIQNQYQLYSNETNILQLNQISPKQLLQTRSEKTATFYNPKAIKDQQKVFDQNPYQNAVNDGSKPNRSIYKKNFNTLSLPELGKSRSISALNLTEVQTPEKSKLIQKKIIKANSARKKQNAIVIRGIPRQLQTVNKDGVQRQSLSQRQKENNTRAHFGKRVS